ncbi:helix-turn-helix transcriptional regulator [Psychrobacter pocilloporae]|uniref:Transcriptional regulator n=1 Tax=Psychrobacter piscatorii TaxID=554343 RepID=A0A0T6DQZ6_9GAMM|nr:MULTISPECIES: WYL domain-containing protein [Psychrobacter]KRU22226.1 transcriptional regulator [Psychrobacter piscatorii]MBZ1393688.1 WYL domain-containing protein [Psychrobacter pacificensis]OLF34495.1 WYL domain-containing protein [Psychrobacter sp. C 20.9]
MTVHSTNANNLQAQSDSDEQAIAIEAAENDVLKETQDNRYGAATTARQWQVLSQLQRNRWVGTTHIYEQLMMAGFDISLRTVQRDLNALAKRFPIEKNNANPQGWRWKEDAPLQSLPHMNLSQAVAFNMVEANLTQLLPPVILDELFPWFDLARRQLKNSKVTHSWIDRVRIEPATQPLIAPDIDLDSKDNIYHALFYQLQINACYTRSNKSEASEYTLNPIAIIQRGVIIYLLATRTDDPKSTIRTFALHRFDRVEILESAAQTPDNFQLDTYLDEGSMGFSHPLFGELAERGKNTAVELQFTQQAGRSLTESKLSDDQIVTSNDDDTLTIKATVNLTSQLVWWLRGFGSGLLDAKPALLYQAVLDQPAMTNNE